MYLNVFFKKLHALKHLLESLRIMNVLLILSTSKMAEGTKQDVHFWKETVLFYLIIVLQEGN